MSGAFSNSDEWFSWAEDHCDVCLRDALHRAGAGPGCPILLRSLIGGAPPEWVPPGSISDNWTCLAIRPLGTGKDGGRRRTRAVGLRPPHRGMLPLFPVSKAGPVVSP